MLKNSPKKEIGDVARTIGAIPNVKLFYTQLGLKDREITIAVMNATSTDLSVRARNVLLEWRKMKPKQATRNMILQAMREMKWNNEIEEVTKMWGK